MFRMLHSRNMDMVHLWLQFDKYSCRMADNFLERHQEEYEAKKKAWEKKKYILKLKALNQKSRQEKKQA